VPATLDNRHSSVDWNQDSVLRPGSFCGGCLPLRIGTSASLSLFWLICFSLSVARASSAMVNRQRFATASARAAG
jgi:hypothetical protein